MFKPYRRPTVAVVGAGVAGCAAASECAFSGFDTVLFEQEPHIGGHFNSALATEVSRKYPSVRRTSASLGLTAHRLLSFATLKRLSRPVAPSSVVPPKLPELNSTAQKDNGKFPTSVIPARKPKHSMS